MNNEQLANFTGKTKKQSPLKAIRTYCKSACCCDDRNSWQDCTLTNCPCFPYRFGKNPFHSARKLKSLQNSAKNLQHFKKNDASSADLTTNKQENLA